MFLVLTLLNISVTSAADFFNANNSTNNLISIIKNDPSNSLAIKKAIQDGADVHVINKDGGTLLHELLYSANRKRKSLSNNLFDVSFPLISLKILLDAGVNPTTSHESKYQYEDSTKSFIEVLKGYSYWPDANSFMDEWIIIKGNSNPFETMAAIAFATVSVACAKALRG